MKKELRDYQKECVEKIFENKKGIVFLPCGTGKTFISQKVVEDTRTSRAIFFAPTIDLLVQTVKEYKEMFSDMEMLLCCSGNFEQEGITRTLNEYEINCFLQQNSDKKFIVFATYASGNYVGDILYESGIDFSIAFYDEAHKINTETKSECFLKLASKSIFLSATPEKEMLEKSSIFGKVIYKKSITEAVNEGLIKDFKVKCIALPEHIGEKHNTGILATLAKKILEKYNLNHSIAFFNTNKSASMFSKFLSEEGFSAKFAWDFETTSCLNNYFANNDRACVSNARKLSEGIDIASIDSVLILEPKYSPTTIQQIIGRAVRKGGNNEFSTIIVPAFLNSQNRFSFGKSAPMMKIISHIKRDAYVSILYDDELVKDRYENLKEDKNVVLKEKKIEAGELLAAIEKQENFRHIVDDSQFEDITEFLTELEKSSSLSGTPSVDDGVNYEVRKACTISMLHFAKHEAVDLSNSQKYSGRQGLLVKNLLRYFWVASNAEKKEIIKCTKQKDPVKNFTNYFQRLVWAYRTHESQPAKYLIGDFMRKGLCTYYLSDKIVSFIKEEFPEYKRNLFNVCPFGNNLRYKKLEYEV